LLTNVGAAVELPPQQWRFFAALGSTELAEFRMTLIVGSE